MEQVIENLKQIRNFTDHPGKFWPVFLELAARLAKAKAGILLVQGKDAGDWKQLGVWPEKESLLSTFPEMHAEIEKIAEASLTKSFAWERAGVSGNKDTNLIILGLCLDVEDTEREHVAVFLLDETDEKTVEQTAKLLQLVADTPAVYQRGRAARQAMNDVVKFSGILDLMVLLNAEKKFTAAAMTFVNEVASRYRCAKASLGWLSGGYISLQAVSHMERFEKKMDIVRTLEAAMEESLDQNEEILWPQPADRASVIRDHEAFSRVQGSQFIVSIPVRLDDVAVGVLTCERSDAPFSEADVYGLRVLCDQAARRLGDLRQNDRWFETQVAEPVRRGASRLLGVEHTLAKVIGVTVCGALFLLLVGKLTYRVEAPFILRSEDVRFLPAPFDGYIDKVFVKVGERVNEGDLLLSLNTRDLLLEESAAIANQIRYLRDADKFRAENQLAEMKIAMSQADQARTELDRVRHNLSRSEVRAPFSGFVVEGELEELQGAAVTKGKVLFKVARLEKMYAEVEVSERDIHEVSEGMSGEMAFVSQPHLKFPIKVERIDSVARAEKDRGNVFLVRLFFPEGRANWWRPGMSGVAKVTVGKRNVLWLLTHRTVDFLRIRLWW